MFSSRLILLVIFSFLLHIGLAVFIYPVFYSDDLQSFLYSWGNIYERGPSFLKKEQSFSLIKAIDYHDFMLPIDKRVSVDFRKITKESKSLKNFPKFKIEQSFLKRQTGFYVDRETILVKTRVLTLLEEDTLLRKFLSRDKIKADLLISPTGKVIWVKGFDFSGDLYLRFDVDDWIRNLVFPPQKTYYWKTIEIVLE